MPEWGYMVDVDLLIREMLALKASLEDFSKRMEKVENELFDNRPVVALCGHSGCTGHYSSDVVCV